MRLLVFTLLCVLAAVRPSAAALPSLETMLAERATGSPDAPVTMIEYSSLTCSHCAHFHRDVLPQIEKAYIETGKVRYIVRDFPLEGRAMAGAMVARCLPPNRYFGFIGLLFRDQQEWAAGSDPLGQLKVRAQLAGLSPADFDACLQTKPLLDGLTAKREAASKQEGIDSTPTFFINGTKLSGAQPFAEFEKAIDAALAKAVR